MENSKSGSIELICGEMFSGKTEEMIRLLRRARIAKQNVQVFKPDIDTRYSSADVVSNDGNSIKATPIKSSFGLICQLKNITTVVGIDEVQFFDDGIIEVIEELADMGIRVIVTGLDMDFRGEPFGCVPIIMAKADHVDKLHAICAVCGEEASRTQRIVNGTPANYSDPVVIVGAAEMYEARCRAHHEVPGKP